MQEYNFGQELSKIITDHFEGGLLKFRDQGFKMGMASLPNDTYELFLYVPVENTSGNRILFALKDYGRKHRIKVHLIDTLNFNGVPLNELTKEYLEPIMEVSSALLAEPTTRITYNLTELICVFDVIGVVNRDTLNEYKMALENIPYLQRAFVICNDVLLSFDKRTRPSVQKVTPQEDILTQDNLNRTKIIGKEDVTNLKIALETAKDIDSFLKML